jgi:calreticulin
LLAIASATVHYKDTFKNLDGWVQSKSKGDDAGKVELSAGKYYGDAEEDKGMKTTQDARFYQLSSKMDHDFSNEGKELIFQFSVKHEQNIDCGGGYLKILPKGLDQENFNGDSTYNIMFGPDICGASTKKTHVILTYKGKNHLIKKDIKCETDQYTHLYTMILRPDNTYEILIDSKSVAKGSIKDDFDMLPPKQIQDPAASKPADWVDDKTIADPTDKKPEGWDDTPSHIADPEAAKPEDWDDELDGEWEAPLIENPEYKGEWKAKSIPNPEYKGAWEHPMIPNPNFFDDDKLYAFSSNAFIGLEIWQVKSGTIFDNVIVTDDESEAKKLAEVTKTLQAAEKKAHDKEEEERKQREEEEKIRNAAAAETGEDDDDDDEDDHDDHDHDDHDEL